MRVFHLVNTLFVFILYVFSFYRHVCFALFCITNYPILGNTVPVFVICTTYCIGIVSNTFYHFVLLQACQSVNANSLGYELYHLTMDSELL